MKAGNGSGRGDDRLKREAGYLEDLAGPGIVPVRTVQQAQGFHRMATTNAGDSSAHPRDLQDATGNSSNSPTRQEPRPTTPTSTANPHRTAATATDARDSPTRPRDLQGAEGCSHGTQLDGILLVLEKAECSLADVLHECGPLPEAEVRAVAVAVAEALVRVHEAGLVHADVKPANLLLSVDGRLWLADFDATVEADGRLLNRTTPYRSPLGATARNATDIVSLAVTLVELATQVVIDSSVRWRIVDLREVGCSPQLSNEVARMLADPSSTTARSVAAAFALSGPGRLPAPVAVTRLHDPTPTVDFMPVKARRNPPPVPGGTLRALSRLPAHPWWASQRRHRNS